MTRPSPTDYREARGGDGIRRTLIVRRPGLLERLPSLLAELDLAGVTVGGATGRTPPDEAVFACRSDEARHVVDVAGETFTLREGEVLYHRGATPDGSARVEWFAVLRIEAFATVLGRLLAAA